MLEFILDFVFDLILEGSTMLLAETKVPMIIRVIAGIIVTGLFLVIAGVLFLIGYSSFVDRQYIGTFVGFGVGIFMLMGGFFYLRKALRKRKEDI